MSRWGAVIERSFDVVSVSGDEYNARCPWHDDRGKPNLYINGVKGLYLCMSCGAKGSLAAQGATPRCGTADVRERLERLMTPPPKQKVYSEGWLRQFDAPTDYWTGRGLSQGSIDRFQLGFDPFGDRVTIPLRDERGRLLGVSKRTILPDVKPKYLDPAGYPKGRYLFGAWLIEDQTKCSLVEGLVDTVSGWESRIPSLGMMGSRLTYDQRKVLIRLGIQKVVVMMDNDRAGIGWDHHRAVYEPSGKPQRPWRCVVCGSLAEDTNRSDHKPGGTYQVADMLKGSGIQVFVGWYRTYWNVKDPDGLNDQRRRKMYHSAVPFRAWREAMSA